MAALRSRGAFPLIDAGSRSLNGAVSPDRAPEDADELSYRELVQSANTIVLRWDLQGRVTFLNDFGLEFFGFPREELLGRSVVGTIVPETETSGRDLVQMIAELLQHPDRYVNNENENMRRDGERVWITWRNRVLHDAAGEARELLSIGIDTSARKRAEEALRDSERRYRVLFQSTPIALVERDVSALEGPPGCAAGGGRRRFRGLPAAASGGGRAPVWTWSR